MEELIKGNDSITRSAKVKVVNSKRGNVTDLRRPIQHLTPLELHVEADNELENDREQVKRAEDQVVENVRQRNRRQAAIKGEFSRRNQEK